MIDPNKIPKPKYKVGDKVWIVDYHSVKEVEISEVRIEGVWFDNGVISKHDFKIGYEISTTWGTRREDQLYNSKRTAQRVLQKNKIEEVAEQLKQARQDKLSLQRRCTSLGLTIDDL